MKVLITGDSHLATMNQGIKLMESNGEWPTGINIVMKPLGNGARFNTPFFIDRGDYAEIVDDTYRKRFKVFPPKNHPYDWIGLSAPLFLSGIWSDSEWQRFTPWNLNISPDTGQKKHTISSAMLRRIILDRVEYRLQFLDIITRTSRVFVIDPPWPFKHHAGVAELGSETVRFLHRQCLEVVSDELAKRGIPIVTIDPTCIGDDGFVLEHLRASPNDPHHGNAEFGRLTMKRVLAFVMEQGTITPHA